MPTDNHYECNEIGGLSFEEIMENRAVTNIAGWTEPNHGGPCDEDAYRARLSKNGPIFQQIEAEVFKFD